MKFRLRSVSLAISILFLVACQKTSLKSATKSDPVEQGEQVTANSNDEREFEENALALFSGSRTQFGIKSGKMSNGELAACFYYSTNLLGQDPKVHYQDEKSFEQLPEGSMSRIRLEKLSKASVSPLLPFALRIQNNTYKNIILKSLKDEKALKSAQIYHSALGGMQTAAGASLAILGAAALTASGLPFALPAELAALDLVPIGAVLEFLAVSGQLGAGIKFIDARKASKQLDQKEYKFSDLTRAERQSLQKYSALAVKSANESKYDLFNNIPPAISEAFARTVLAYPKEDLTIIRCAESSQSTQFAL